MRPEDAVEAAAEGEGASMLGRRSPDPQRAPRGPLALAAGCLALAAAAAGVARLAARPGAATRLAPARAPRLRPTPMSSLAAEGCEDAPGSQSGAVWSDGSNGCQAYEGDPSFCALYGAMDIGGEGAAKDHCCACGGGRAIEAQPVASLGHAGCEDASAKSGAVWSDGTNTCEAYEGEPTFCGLYGSVDFNGEGAAKDHCCACGGGRAILADHRPSTSVKTIETTEEVSSTRESSMPTATPESVTSRATVSRLGPAPEPKPNASARVDPGRPGDCTVYSAESTNCAGSDYSGKCGTCFNAGARSGVICPGERTGYQCPPDEPDVPGGMAFACMDWTFGSTAMIAAEASYNCRSGGDPVYFGVGTYGVSSSTDVMGGLGVCVRMEIEGLQRDIIAQSINTGHDVSGNQFDLQIGAGGAGAFNTCAGDANSMFPGPKKAWGHQYGGPDKKEQCKKLPPYPRDSGPMKSAGDNLIELCEYAFDQGVFSNPTILYIERVACPSELVNLTQFRRTDGPDADSGIDSMTAAPRARGLLKAAKRRCNTDPGVGLDWCQTRMMDCRKPSGAVRDNVVEELVAPGLKLVQPCTADGYTRIDVQCGCYDCYC